MIRIIGHKEISEIIKECDDTYKCDGVLSLNKEELETLLSDEFRSDVQSELDRRESFELQKKIDQEKFEKEKQECLSKQNQTMILFPGHPSYPRDPDPAFRNEIDAAREAGFKVGFVSPLRDIYVNSKIPCLYRGWIEKPSWYKDLYEQEPNLVTIPMEYANSYNFPEWYSQVRDHCDSCIETPLSWYFKIPSNCNVENALQYIEDAGIRSMMSKSVIIKDWVKSRKYEWFDACYIKDTSDKAEFDRVVGNFIREQGDSLACGLVFREFIKLKQVGVHDKCDMPLFNEHRFFVFKGQIIYSAPNYSPREEDWPRNFYDTPSKKLILSLVKNINSSFYSIDVAQTEDDEWIVIEINDGGTSGVPEGGSIKEFYEALKEVF